MESLHSVAMFDLLTSTADVSLPFPTHCVYSKLKVLHSFLTLFVLDFCTVVLTDLHTQSSWWSANMSDSSLQLSVIADGEIWQAEFPFSIFKVGVVKFSHSVGVLSSSSMQEAEFTAGISDYTSYTGISCSLPHQKQRCIWLRIVIRIVSLTEIIITEYSTFFFLPLLIQDFQVQLLRSIPKAWCCRLFVSPISGL